MSGFCLKLQWGEGGDCPVLVSTIYLFRIHSLPISKKKNLKTLLILTCRSGGKCLDFETSLNVPALEKSLPAHVGQPYEDPPFTNTRATQAEGCGKCQDDRKKELRDKSFPTYILHGPETLQPENLRLTVEGNRFGKHPPTETSKVSIRETQRKES